MAQDGAMTKKEHIITVHDRMRIAVEAMCHPKSVQRYYQGGLMKPMTELRIQKAAKTLGFPLPGEFTQPPPPPMPAKKAQKRITPSSVRPPVKGVARAVRRGGGAHARRGDTSSVDCPKRPYRTFRVCQSVTVGCSVGVTSRPPKITRNRDSSSLDSANCSSRSSSCITAASVSTLASFACALSSVSTIDNR